jgi:hypothetical protein
VKIGFFEDEDEDDDEDEKDFLPAGTKLHTCS